MSADTPIDRPVYVTTYGLTRHIEIHRKGCIHIADSGATYFRPEGRFSVLVEEKNWTHDPDEARKRITKQACAKIVSLKKQIAKIEEKLTHVPKWPTFEEIP